MQMKFAAGSRASSPRRLVLDDGLDDVLAVLLDGDAHVLLYKGGSGTVKVLRLDGAGSSTSTIWNGSWTKGWA